MKVIIEIPDSNVIANTEGCFGISFDGMDYQKIIMGGTPIPDNVTNGDMIKAMFNCMVIDITNGKVYVEKIYFPFDEDWWNAPYKTNKRN